MFPQFFSKMLYLVFRKSGVLPQTQRATGTIHVEDRSESLPNDVNVRRPMVVGIDNDP